MGRQKAVVSTDAAAMAEVERLVRENRYASVSEFVREAIAEKLVRLKRERLEEQVARYGQEAGTDEDDDLVASQAFPKRRKR